jgi:hypothetical protein
MKLRLISVIALASAFPLASQNDVKIGVVLALDGAWCSQAKELKINDPIHLKDEITYCGKPPKPTDRIVVRFDGKEPYDRPYECATPGICDPDAKLWLLGAYTRQHSKSPGGILQSAPRTTSEFVLPDTIFKAGKDSDGGSMRAMAYVGIPPREGRGPRFPSIEFCEFGDPKANRCFDDWEAISSPGVYAIFLKENKQIAIALVAVVPSHSSAAVEWLAIPEAYRKDKTPQTVVERRAYLMELVKSTQQ